MFTRVQPTKATTTLASACVSETQTPPARVYLSTKRFLKSPFPVVDSGSTISMVGEKWLRDHVDGCPEYSYVPEVSAQMGEGPVLTPNKLTSIAIKPKGEVGDTAYVNCYVVTTNFPLVPPDPIIAPETILFHN